MMIKLTKFAYPLSKFNNPLVCLSYNINYAFTIKKKSSKMWMHEHVNDSYVKKARLVYWTSWIQIKIYIA